jgi:hypothetical protein
VLHFGVFIFLDLAKPDGKSTLPYSSFKYQYRTNAQFGDQTRPWFSINVLDDVFARGMTPAFVIPCPDNAPNIFQDEALLTTKAKVRALRYYCIDYDRLHRSGISPQESVSWMERFNQGKIEAVKANALPLFTSSEEELQASWRNLFKYRSIEKRREEQSNGHGENDFESENEDEADELDFL